jgi:hypothetical protein
LKSPLQLPVVFRLASESSEKRTKFVRFCNRDSHGFSGVPTRVFQNTSVCVSSHTPPPSCAIATRLDNTVAAVAVGGHIRMMSGTLPHVEEMRWMGMP